LAGHELAEKLVAKQHGAPNRFAVRPQVERSLLASPATTGGGARLQHPHEATNRRRNNALVIKK
jgi:hypothetical protein